jgi:spore coat protein H
VITVASRPPHPRLLAPAHLLILALWGFGGCGGVERPDGWTETTHGKDAPPNYDLVLNSREVQSIHITIAPSDFQVMQADLAEVVGNTGAMLGGNLPAGGLPAGQLPAEMTAACVGHAEKDACESPLQQSVQGTCELQNGELVCLPAGGFPGQPDGGQPPAGMGNMTMTTQDPAYIPVTVQYAGNSWWFVGMRYKGNSSLSSSYREDNGKLPFRLNFDKFESEHPEVDDQRFNGFKELTFASNWSDDSQIREAFASELLRDRSIPAARCAFYRVSVDVGNGLEYWGLYTAIEDPSDKAMLDSQLGSHNGNLYKPEGTGADWTVFSTEGFVKKNNEDAADYSDVQAAVSALLADQNDAAAWRTGLEMTFDVDSFLRWLAVNTAMQNWDSYGRMAHNYYLYGDPAKNGQLRWIPWDHNMSMMSQTAAIGGGQSALTDLQLTATAEVFHTDAGSNWPLISRTLADPVYLQRYRELLPHALGGLFEFEAAAARMREMHALIEPHVVGENGERPGYTTISSAEAFRQSIDGEKGLIATITARRALVTEALAAP